jgi:Protein of unknown function (DUF5132)
MNERTRTLFAFAAGVAAGVSLPVIVPAVAEASRPLAKSLIKHGLLAYDRARTGIARAAESLEDIVAEAKFEAEQSFAAPGEATAAATPAVEEPAARPAANPKVFS